jgi:hypothetical protein
MDTTLGSLHNLNHWSILVSALILWFLGAIWYSPVLFAKPWMAMVHVPTGEGKKKSMMAGMIASFLCDLVLSYILWHAVNWAHADTWMMGALVGLLLWIGFIAAPSLPQGIYEGRPFKLFAINAGYWLVGLVICGGLVAVWRWS